MHYVSLFCFIYVNSCNSASLSALGATNTSGPCNTRAFSQFSGAFYLSESDLIVHIVLSVREARKGYTAHRKAISFTSNRREHVPGARCCMDPGNK